ncbi:hypothetical protein EG329_001031 [Mollisiaceae sp. DMI_Dod_QoI]|nr:hypothetical protein EG329_001031 [Helotiales sp. DMI_Dod_QoI]
MSPQIHILTIGPSKQESTDLLKTMTKVCLPGSFDEEQEEIREIANRELPEMKLVMVPNDLDAKDSDESGEKRRSEGLVEYLREQVESRFEG